MGMGNADDMQALEETNRAHCYTVQSGLGKRFDRVWRYITFFVLIEFIKLGELFFCLVEGRPHGRRVPSVGNHYPSLFVLFASFFVKYDGR